MDSLFHRDIEFPQRPDAQDTVDEQPVPVLKQAKSLVKLLIKKVRVAHGCPGQIFREGETFTQDRNAAVMIAHLEFRSIGNERPPSPALNIGIKREAMPELLIARIGGP